MDPATASRSDALLAANAAGTLDAPGREELVRLRSDSDALMFRKAYAAVLLRWRGELVPSLAEMENEAAAR